MKKLVTGTYVFTPGKAVKNKVWQPNFIRSQFPPSSENVLDLYVIDDDELYGDHVDWDAVIKELLEKKMGI